jgi:hypothetical protein
MTRRDFCSLAAFGMTRISRPPLVVPVHFLQDEDAQLRPESLRNFWWRIWPQAAREFGRCGMRLQSSFSTGHVTRPHDRPPVIAGLEPGAINLVITNEIPVFWDNGRALSGVTTLYRGFHVCMIALNHAHGNQIPLISVNTCVHELLHALLQDIFERRPPGWRGEAREFRIDCFATRLWLFQDGAAIRRSAAQYVERLGTASSAKAG